MTATSARRGHRFSHRFSRRHLLAGMPAMALLAGCAQSRNGSDSTELRIGTGPEGASYREVGVEIAELINQELSGVSAAVEYTDAGWQNVLLLREGTIDLALTNTDIAEYEQTQALALGRLFESVYHVVVPKDSDIRSFNDLNTRRVACGMPLSGTRFISERAFDVAGIQPHIEDYSQTASMEALSNGRVEAMISLTAMPTPALLNAELQDYRLISMDDVVELLIQEHPMHYLPVTVPSSMYPGLGTTLTVGVPSLLVAPPTMSNELASRITELVFTHPSELAQAHPGAGQINIRTGSATVPLALHPGASDWFTSIKP